MGGAIPRIRKVTMNIARDENGKLPFYAWPGGYPLVYAMADGGNICSKCANGENGSLAGFVGEERENIADVLCPLTPDDKQWIITGVDVHYEGAPIQCDHCNANIESAYGDPDADANGEEDNA